MKKDLFKFVILLAVALGSAPSYSAYWNWSKTAATNATADASINWSEGMSPSSVNDSARAMMARSAEQRDDTSGLLATAGTSTAYTVTTFQGLNTPTPTDGQYIAVTMSATNGVTPTLAADGGTAYPIQSSAGVAVASGTLISGSPYTLKFSVANSAWMLRNFYAAPFSVPIGAMLPYTGDTAPNSNFVLPGGQCISRTTYATYFALVGTRFSTCDGVSTFGVPDMRGRVPTGIDNLGGSAAGRLTNSVVGCGTSINAVGTFCALGSQSHTLTTSELAIHNHNGSTGFGGVDHSHSQATPGATNGGFTGPGGNGWGGPYPNNSTQTGSATAFLHTHPFTTDNAGSSTPFGIINPNLGVSYILRVQ